MLIYVNKIFRFSSIFLIFSLDNFEFRMKFIDICNEFDDTENLIKCIFER